ncbi:CU044_2847 family protein [Longispora urticae]
MRELVELEMPDGQVIWATVEDAGPGDVGLLPGATTLRGFAESLDSVATNVRAALAKAAPDETTVEFGLELAAGKNGVVAALAGVSGAATLKVTMTWKRPEAPAGH